jgi:hypothetical protein
MTKTLSLFIYLIALASAGLSIHQAFAQRGPSVEPMAEVSIEEERQVPSNGPVKGYDFSEKSHQPKVSPAKRTPAMTEVKSPEHRFPHSYIGPIIFLLALPVAAWIVISKKLSSSDRIENKGYYPKTYQFKNYKSGTHDSDYEDDDQEFPKAS